MCLPWECCWARKALLTAVLSAVVSGCWQEVRYDPAAAPEGPTPSTRAQSHDTPSDETSSDQSPPPEESSLPPAPQPSADEMFNLDEAPVDVRETTFADPVDPVSTVVKKQSPEILRLEPTETSAEEEEESEPTDSSMDAAISPDRGTELDAFVDDLFGGFFDSVTDIHGESPPAPPAPVDEPTSAATLNVVTVAAREAAARQRELTWQAASHWSLAVALRGKGVASDVYQPQQQAAEAAAEELHIQLPPTMVVDASPAAAADAMRLEAGPKLWQQIFRQAGLPAAAAAELACRSHALLLDYSPLAEGRGDTAAIRAAADASGLPLELWLPLIELLERRGSYGDVKGAVFELHRRVTRYLGAR